MQDYTNYLTIENNNQRIIRINSTNKEERGNETWNVLTVQFLKYYPCYNYEIISSINIKIFYSDLILSTDRML